MMLIRIKIPTAIKARLIQNAHLIILVCLVYNKQKPTPQWYNNPFRVLISSDAGVLAYYPQPWIVQIPTRGKLLNALSLLTTKSRFDITNLVKRTYSTARTRLLFGIFNQTQISQYFSLTFFLSSWATKYCPGFCHVRFSTYLSAAFQDKQKLLLWVQLSTKCWVWGVRHTAISTARLLVRWQLWYLENILLCSTKT